MQTRGAHLSYCLNVHPTRTLEDVCDNLRTYTRAVKAAVCPDRPFGLGLWLPVAAAAEVRRAPELLADLLAAEDFYLFTLNGFPYGAFHGQAVKTAVYRPDWSTPERLAYTQDLLHAMAALLPAGVEGSISTVPVTYGKSLPPGAIANLLAAAETARQIAADTGKIIRLALEPEPDCYLETTAEAIAFFDLLRAADSRADEYLGVCFDTCHLCLQREDLETAYRSLLAAGIRIPKVQISAALRYANSGDAPAGLGAYDEPVYLHQSRVYDGDRELARYPDLGPALAANPAGDWVVHFHVPLPFTGAGALGSTADAITPAFLDLAFAHSPNLEIETYTFLVLPDPKPSMVDSIAGEFAWLRDRLG